MARKQVLQINKFSGGVNSYSDPRDLEENEFQILDNASVDEEGVIRVSGGLEVKNNIDISSIGDSLYLPGEGLFGYSTDYYENQRAEYALVIKKKVKQMMSGKYDAWYNDC